MSDDIFSVGGYIQAGSYGFNPTVGTNGLAANPYATPYGYLGDLALQHALDILDRKYQAAQAYVDGLDRAAAEAGSHIGGHSGGSGGGGNSAGSGVGGIHDPDGNGDGGATNAGSLSQGAGYTTGTFTPPGTWSGGGTGTPDPGLPINPDYVGIQPIILDLDGDGFQESGSWAARNLSERLDMGRVAA